MAIKTKADIDVDIAGRRTGAGLPQPYASLSGSKPSRSAPENVRGAPAALGAGHHKSAVVTLLQPPPNVRAARYFCAPRPRYALSVGAVFLARSEPAPSPCRGAWWA
jgi:hypothetical protein